MKGKEKYNTYLRHEQEKYKQNTKIQSTMMKFGFSAKKSMTRVYWFKDVFYGKADHVFRNKENMFDRKLGNLKTKPLTLLFSWNCKWSGSYSTCQMTKLSYSEY